MTVAKKLLDEPKEEKQTIVSKQIVCVKSDGPIFNFNTFKVRACFKYS